MDKRLSARALRKLERAIIERIKMVFDQIAFKPAFLADLRVSRSLVLLQAPYLTRREVGAYMEVFKACIKRGVRVCVFIQMPKNWERRHQADFAFRSKYLETESCMRELEAIGVHVNMRESIHEKLAIIDNHIFWDGSLNILSHFDTKERVTRWDSTVEAKAATAMHKLDTCNRCAANELFALYTGTTTEHERRRLIVEFISARRKALGVTQTILGEIGGLHQSAMSRFEQCLMDTEFQRVIAMANHVDVVLLPVPKHIVPALLQIIAFYELTDHKKTEKI
jgi:hypothetical protein